MEWEFISLNTESKSLNPDTITAISSKLMKQKSLTSGEGVYAVYNINDQKYLVCVINVTHPSSEPEKQENHS